MPASTASEIAERWLFSTIFSSAAGGDFDRVNVFSLLRGAKVESDRLRAAGLFERKLLLGDFLAVFQKFDLHDAARQADAFDRSRDAGDDC